MSVTPTQNLNRVDLASALAKRLINREQSEHGTPAREAVKSVARKLRTTASQIGRLARKELSDVATTTFFALCAAEERGLKNEIHKMEQALLEIDCGRRHVAPAALEKARAALDEAKQWLTEGSE